MSLDVEIDLVNYPNITISQTPGFLNPAYKLHVPLKDVSRLFQNIFATIPSYEKVNLSIADKIKAAKSLGLDYVYRRPDIYRTGLYSAGAVFITLGLSENKFLQIAATTITQTALKVLPTLATSPHVSTISNMGNAILKNKIMTGAALVATGIASNAVSDATSESFIKIGQSLKDLAAGIADIAPSLYRGAKNTCNATAAVFNAYKNAWANNEKKMIHAHALAGIAALVLSAPKLV